MLGLGAIDVNGVSIRDGYHEHRRVAGLAIVVPAVASTVRASFGVAGDRLEIREDCVVLGLARVVCG